MNVEEKIIFLEQALDELFNKKIKLNLETNLIEDLKLDSLDIVELQMYYEDKTGIILSDESIAVNTVNDLVILMK